MRDNAISAADQAELAALLRRAGARDQVAFAELYDRTSAKLFGVCLRILKTREMAEEAAQEAYVKIWRNAERYAEQRGSPIAWMAVIARNQAIDRLRAMPAPARPLDARHEPIDPAPTPEAAAVARGEASRLQRCMDAIEARQARALRLTYLEGRTYQQAADALSTPLNTVKTWVRRGLIALRSCLDDGDGP